MYWVPFNGRPFAFLRFGSLCAQQSWDSSYLGRCHSSGHTGALPVHKMVGSGDESQGRDDFLSDSLAQRGGKGEAGRGRDTLQASECPASFVVSKRYQISYQAPTLFSAKSTSRLNFNVSIVTTMKVSFRSEENQRSPATYFLGLNIHSSMTPGSNPSPNNPPLS